ncbi:MAG: hypothetical protein ACI9LO_001333 [Planctomycetota bacterium]|jgi:hypothetical protein
MVKSFFFLFFVASIFFPAHAERQNNAITLEPFSCGDGFNCTRIRGNSKGNHDLDCTIIRPWASAADPLQSPYPVIAWANGWEQGNVLGQCTSNGYRLGLKQWAADGPYIVVAANQWSVRDVDVLACLQYVVENEDAADTNWTGLAGHSQGGGAVIKAGDGLQKQVNVTASIAMNPYGPSWVNAEQQDGPLMLLGGNADTTTPVSSFISVWEAIQTNQGGLLAVRGGGTHNNDAWGSYPNGATMSCEDAAEVNFGNFQEAGRLWWDRHLNGNFASGAALKAMLQQSSWDTQFSPADDPDL